jgi:putative transposase
MLAYCQMAGLDGKEAGRKNKPRPKAAPRGRAARRYRAYPTAEQIALIKRSGGSARYIKNMAKEQRDKAWAERHKSISYTEQSKWVLAYRKGPEAPWLAEVPAQVLQQALHDTDDAYKAFFDGRTRYPVWQRRSGWYSFRGPQNVRYRRTSKRWGEVKVQGLGPLRARHHRSLVGRSVESATVVLEPVITDKHKRAPTKPKVAR